MQGSGQRITLMVIENRLQDRAWEPAVIRSQMARFTKEIPRSRILLTPGCNRLILQFLSKEVRLRITWRAQYFQSTTKMLHKVSMAGVLPPPQMKLPKEQELQVKCSLMVSQAIQLLMEISW